MNTATLDRFLSTLAFLAVGVYLLWSAASASSTLLTAWLAFAGVVSLWAAACGIATAVRRAR